MPLEGRDGLIARFQKGYIPDTNDFRTLIDSSVNKKDDQFFGRWQRGMKYCNGDVVLYNKSLYMLDLNQKTADCPPEDNGQVEQDEKEANCICSTEPPTKGDCWCLLELLVDDNDWRVIEDEDTGEPKVVYTLSADVGIGTDAPQSQLDVHADQGSIQLDPNHDGTPGIKIIRFQTDEGAKEDEQVAISLAQQLCHHTNTLGYAFYRKAQQESNSGSLAKQTTRSLKNDDDPVLLLFATSTDDDIPQLGIGTNDPKASLDVVAPDRGRLMVHPFPGEADASTLLINTKPTGNGHYLLTSVNDDCAYLQTDAEKGLKIIQGDDASSLVSKTDSKSTSVTFDKTGQVGIGTEEPHSKLHITDGKSGSIRADFSQDNVCISTINERPNKTYAAMGVDDDCATLITDTPYGFVFKSGEPYGDGNLKNEVNINQGINVAYISPEGKMGLRTMDVPQDYDLDVRGQIRSMTSYLHTDSSTIKVIKELKDEKILERVCELNPVRFKFNENTNASHEGEQIGFKASNVYDHFPELTSKAEKHKSIAYANMTAVLVQAIKEQQAIIEELNQRLCDLEEQAGNDTGD